MVETDDACDRSIGDGVLLDVRGLTTGFATAHGWITAVDGVSLRIPRGSTVALVGESGCGKSVTALSILRLIPEPPGRILAGEILLTESSTRDPDALDGRPPGAVDLLRLSETRMRGIRGNRIAMVFQDPHASMNPVQTIGRQVIEAIELHQPLRGRAARRAAVDLLRQVKIPSPEWRIDEYPHRISGGMRQRVMIAMALACRPSLLIADEPTTALDVTVQLALLTLLRELQVETGMSMLLITHDFGVVAEAADDVYVMYAGRIVEHGPVNEVIAHPLHPYTQGLMHCTPRLSLRKERLAVIPGCVPDPTDYPSGCRFHPRCRLSAERATAAGRNTASVRSEVGDKILARCVGRHEAEPSGMPELRQVRPRHYVACWEVGGSPPMGDGASVPAQERGYGSPPVEKV